MSEKHVTVNGWTVNTRTINMLHYAERLAGHTFTVTQGSYRAGQVAASAGTHDGGGVIDVQPSKDPAGDVDALRHAGFIAWYRRPSQASAAHPWPFHIHAIAYGDVEMAPAAKQQVADYFSGYNGLIGNAPDDSPRPVPFHTWEQIDPRRPAGHPPEITPGSTQRSWIKYLQQLLNARGARLPVDGIYGPATQARVRRFRARHGMLPYAKVGTYVWKALDVR